jgi:hypothetical protein
MSEHRSGNPERVGHDQSDRHDRREDGATSHGAGSTARLLLWILAAVALPILGLLLLAVPGFALGAVGGIALVVWVVKNRNPAPTDPAS